MPVVGDLLTGRELLTLPVTATALAAARAMTEHKVGAVLVMDASGVLQGIFTERDLMSRVVVRAIDPGRVALSEVMTRNVYTVARDVKVCAVRKELSRRHIRHVPIVDGGHVLGMLSLRDILRADLAEVVSEVHELQGYFLGDHEKSSDWDD
jgi:signal-transduction protein with cAMP-binding, CBS, and nucleotidyltransferase domain